MLPAEAICKRSSERIPKVVVCLALSVSARATTSGQVSDVSTRSPAVRSVSIRASALFAPVDRRGPKAECLARRTRRAQRGKCGAEDITLVLAKLPQRRDGLRVVRIDRVLPLSPRARASALTYRRNPTTAITVNSSDNQTPRRDRRRSRPAEGRHGAQLQLAARASPEAHTQGGATVGRCGLRARAGGQRWKANSPARNQPPRRQRRLAFGRNREIVL